MVIKQALTQLSVEVDSLVVVLKRCKHRPESSRLVRKCSCHQSTISCVYCQLKLMLGTVPPGQLVSPRLTPAGTLLLASDSACLANAVEAQLGAVGVLHFVQHQRGLCEAS